MLYIYINISPTRDSYNSVSFTKRKYWFVICDGLLIICFCLYPSIYTLQSVWAVGLTLIVIILMDSMQDNLEKQQWFNVLCCPNFWANEVKLLYKIQLPIFIINFMKNTGKKASTYYVAYSSDYKAKVT